MHWSNNCHHNQPFGLDFDKFKAAYGQVAGGGTTSVTPDGQISTSFGNWDPSNTYANYVQNINRRTDSGNIIPGFTFSGDEAEQKRILAGGGRVY